jgi:hypothetical protein
MFSQLQLYGIILYVEPAVTRPTQFRHYKMQNTGLCEQMNALLPGVALDLPLYKTEQETKNSLISAVVTVLDVGITVEVSVTLPCSTASLDGR